MIDRWFIFLQYNCFGHKDYVRYEKPIRVIDGFIYTYSHETYHGYIGYIHPEQKHNGNAFNISNTHAEIKLQALAKKD